MIGNSEEYHAGDCKFSCSEHLRESLRWSSSAIRGHPRCGLFALLRAYPGVDMLFEQIEGHGAGVDHLIMEGTDVELVS